MHALEARHAPVVSLWVWYHVGGRDEVLANALRYSNLVFGAAVLIWITNLLAAALRGAGNVNVPATS